MARARGLPSGKVVTISDSAAGATIAPPAPCTEQLDHPGSVNFGLGALRWERHLQELTKSEPVVHRRPAVRCPNDKCRQRALWTRADGMTECRKCGRLLHEHEYAP